jgi:hypothetical protein
MLSISKPILPSPSIFASFARRGIYDGGIGRPKRIFFLEKN